MPQVNFNWENILEMAKKTGIPPKKRAIIREYLQTQFLNFLYAQKKSFKLNFIGGTSLRLLYNLDRFSEDLDFDNLGLSFFEIKKLFLNAIEKLKKQGFKTEFDFKKTNHSGIGRLRFVNLLSELEISKDPKEKLMIKLDFTTPKIKSTSSVLILNRFGIIQNVVVANLSSILSQKIKAILFRKDLQPRDFYDLVWLISQDIKPDQNLLKSLKIKNENKIWQKILNRFQKEMKQNIKIYKQKLLPFLLNPEKVRYLDLFENLIKTKLTKEE
ncbi:nucleotidyl transferase AbiEii/AbiGii toxin family protein [Patescibacteria group bacterium]|nr:nucleotidyl transferase AbiEii/AbiGii toxin family protein [Patescibacteria group bacterium]MBU1663679.1 nucleotidyl transferase AbiEii/AbiGii toxin family protein [Patescibacteria group bacterium]MBU1933966.1 nucleotidyl transferase AbiEii/AbiGii toxin family protein [Patescibacteria group bacterium]